MTERALIIYRCRGDQGACQRPNVCMLYIPLLTSNLIYIGVGKLVTEMCDL